MRRPGDSSQKKDDSNPNRKFIDRHQAQAPGLPRSADRSMYGVGQGDRPVESTDWQVAHSEKVLVYHENAEQSGNEGWMDQLKQDSMQFLADQRGVKLQEIHQESVYKTGIAILIDKIYGLLQRYTFEFNQVAGGTDLHVSGTISGDVTEVTRYNRLREAEETKTFFRCRFSTRHFALNVRGRDDMVECYLLPINKVMALSISESEYPPLCTIQVKITEQGMMWRMRSGEIEVDTLEQLCMWLFAQLVSETKSCVNRGKERG